MTSELRPAVEVATDCYEQEFFGIEAAAAVIKADREAVRAEQAREIARLKTAWEAQHREKVKEREEAKLWFEQAQEVKAELAKFKALAETLAGALGPLRNAAEAVADSLNTAVMDGAIDKADKALRQYKEARDGS